MPRTDRNQTWDADGNLVDDEYVIIPDLPLDATGALAALLAVQGVVTVDDAANAVGLAPEQLVTEAQAWALE